MLYVTEIWEGTATAVPVVDLGAAAQLVVAAEAELERRGFYRDNEPPPPGTDYDAALDAFPRRARYVSPAGGLEDYLVVATGTETLELLDALGINDDEFLPLPAFAGVSFETLARVVWRDRRDSDYLALRQAARDLDDVANEITATDVR